MLLGCTFSCKGALSYSREIVQGYLKDFSFETETILLTDLYLNYVFVVAVSFLGKDERSREAEHLNQIST